MNSKHLVQKFSLIASVVVILFAAPGVIQAQSSDFSSAGSTIFIVPRLNLRQSAFPGGVSGNPTAAILNFTNPDPTCNDTVIELFKSGSGSSLGYILGRAQNGNSDVNGHFAVVPLVGNRFDYQLVRGESCNITVRTIGYLYATPTFDLSMAGAKMQITPGNVSSSARPASIVGSPVAAILNFTNPDSTCDDTVIALSTTYGTSLGYIFGRAQNANFDVRGGFAVVPLINNQFNHRLVRGESCPIDVRTIGYAYESSAVDFSEAGAARSMTPTVSRQTFYPALMSERLVAMKGNPSAAILNFTNPNATCNDPVIELFRSGNGPSLGYIFSRVQNGSADVKGDFAVIPLVNRTFDYNLVRGNSCPIDIKVIGYLYPTGTIIQKATKDGADWNSPPFAEVYDAPYGANQTAILDLPATFTDMPVGAYRVTSVTPPAGVILQNINGSPLPYSATLAPGGTITVTYNFVTIPGTIIEKATKDGVAWDSPPFAEVYDAPYGANQTAILDLPATFTDMPVGAYRVTSVTPPAGVILQNINGSPLPYSATLAPGGTITVTYNFVTLPPTTGTLQIRATKDGVAWDSPAFPVNMLLPGGSVGDMSVNPPQDIANSPLGAYRINGVTPPAGVTFQNVNGSSLPYSQNLAGGSTITFTFNFTTTVVAVPTLVVTPSSASVGINGAQQFNAIYDPDGSGPQFSSTVTNLSGWASSNNSVATASSVGVATGVSAGFATITASYAGLTASASLTVTAPTPTLDVTPSSAIVEIGDTKQFNATYDPDGPSGPQPVQDVTATAVWSSVDTAKVTVSSGLAVRVGHGLTNVRAVYVGLSDSAAVLDPATLRVDPRLAELVSEQTVQLKAFYDSDGSTGSDPETEVTQLTDWSSRNPAVASVDNASAKGLVTAGSVSRTQTSDIFAGYSGLSDAARITVLAAQVPTVTLSASPSSVNSGGSSSLTWSVANANSCSASGGWSGAKSPSGGSESTGSLTVATTFTLTCSNANGSSSASAAVSIVASPVPQAPSNLRVVSSSLNSCGTIGLAWRDNSDSETRFEMERNSGSGFVKIAEPAQNTTNFVDTTIRQNTSYSYRVRACNSFGCSAYSNTATGNNQSPAANFTFAPANPHVNQPVLFTDMSEYFGIVASRQWTFEDGNPALVTVSGATTTAKFIDAEPEEKTVILRAADTVGRICTIAKKVPVKLGSTPPDWEEEPPE